MEEEEEKKKEEEKEKENAGKSQENSVDMGVFLNVCYKRRV